MKVHAALKGSFLPAADAEVLLCKALKKDRVWLLTHPDYELSDAEWTLFGQFIGRRRRHEPVVYITGEQEFYGRMFDVDPRVLIPRPATEGVVRAALEFLKLPKNNSEEVDSGIVVTSRILKNLNKPKLIVDIGTGSGCIAITLALERPDQRIIATDISADALDVARSNAIKHHADNRVTFREGSGLDPIKDITEPFLLVSNPPYVPSVRTLVPDVQDFEPHVAIFGGEQGANLIREIAQGAKSHQMCTGLIMECEMEQIHLLDALIR